jgi:hypothetical protein
MNKQYNNNSTELVNLQYPDLFAEILCFLVNKQYDRMEKIQEEIFLEEI